MNMMYWERQTLISHLWAWRMIMWFFLAIYFFPTVFIMMAGTIDIIMIVWGFGVSAAAVASYESTYRQVHTELARRERNTLATKGIYK